MTRLIKQKKISAPSLLNLRLNNGRRLCASNIKEIWETKSGRTPDYSGAFHFCRQFKVDVHHRLVLFFSNFVVADLDIE